MKSVREKYAQGEISAYYVLDLLDAAMEELHGCLSGAENDSWMSGSERDEIDFEEEANELRNIIKTLENGEIP